MRISDWSSDVCSSDLRQHLVRQTERIELAHVEILVAEHLHHDIRRCRVTRLDLMFHAANSVAIRRLFRPQFKCRFWRSTLRTAPVVRQFAELRARRDAVIRSAEHKSELQSLLPISY